jgi:exonuclease SbcD
MRAFLDWLHRLVQENRADLLLVSGDVFDTGMPQHEAVARYYEFLTRISSLGHCQVIITGGNHDSAAMLNAPRHLLEQLRIHIVGNLPENLQEAIFEFPECTVCAIPFLRDRDLRRYLEGNSVLTSDQAVRAAIGTTYKQALELAAARKLPVIAMGHLTAEGASRNPDSERDIHVGNLASVGPSIFHGFAYVALGHLHQCQSVAGVDTIRYSGSPIPLSFAEADYQHQVVLLEVENGNLAWTKHPVPQRRALKRFTGTPSEIASQLIECPLGDPATLPMAELNLQGTALDLVIDRRLRDAADKRVEILKITSDRILSAADTFASAPQHLDEITPAEIFASKLVQVGIAPDSQESAELQQLFQELYQKWQEAAIEVTD